jgi:hypothetical protein
MLRAAQGKIKPTLGGMKNSHVIARLLQTLSRLDVALTLPLQYVLDLPQAQHLTLPQSLEEIATKVYATSRVTLESGLRTGISPRIFSHLIMESLIKELVHHPDV